MITPRSDVEEILEEARDNLDRGIIITAKVYYKIQVTTTLTEDSLWHDWRADSSTTKFSFRTAAFDEASRIEVRYKFIKNTRVVKVTTTYSIVDKPED